MSKGKRYKNYTRRAARNPPQRKKPKWTNVPLKDSTSRFIPGKAENGESSVKEPLSLVEEMERKGFSVVTKYTLFQGANCITFRDDKICFRRGILSSLGDPDSVAFFINPDNKRLAIAAAGNSSGQIYSCKKYKSGAADFCNSRLVRHIFKIMDWDEKNRYVVQAEPIQTADGLVLDFDLTKAKFAPITKQPGRARQYPAEPDSQSIEPLWSDEYEEVSG